MVRFTETSFAHTSGWRHDRAWQSVNAMTICPSIARNLHRGAALSRTREKPRNQVLQRRTSSEFSFPLATGPAKINEDERSFIVTLCVFYPPRPLQPRSTP